MEGNRINHQEVPDSFKKGNSGSQEIALVEFTPLIRKIARALAPEDPRLREDLVQEGFLSLILASASYDSERGPFAAFARRCARNRMISYLRRLRPCLALKDEEMEELPLNSSRMRKLTSALPGNRFSIS